MPITAVTPSITNQGLLTQRGVNKTLDKDVFLNLLIIQMQHQDPLEPMKNSDFLAQMAQFSGLEQLKNVNKNLEFLQMYQASLNNTQAMSFIGKEIRALGNLIQVTDGTSSDIHYRLDDDAAVVKISIYDSDNNLVRIIQEGPQDSGEQVVQWDGKDIKGNRLTDGEYTFSVSAVDFKDNTVSATTYIAGQVTGLTFEDNITYLLLGTRKIALGKVIEVKEREG